jgi:hypothetical protein
MYIKSTTQEQVDKERARSILIGDYLGLFSIAMLVVVPLLWIFNQ